jgi:hypothetical protein
MMFDSILENYRMNKTKIMSIAAFAAVALVNMIASAYVADNIRRSGSMSGNDHLIGAQSAASWSSMISALATVGSIGVILFIIY